MKEWELARYKNGTIDEYLYDYLDKQDRNMSMFSVEEGMRAIRGLDGYVFFQLQPCLLCKLKDMGIN